MAGEDEVEHHDAERGPQRIEIRALVVEHRARRLACSHGRQKRTDHRRPRDGDDRTQEEGETRIDVQDRKRSQRPTHERDRQPNRDESMHGAARLLRQVGEAQLQPALEEQQGNQERHQREQRLAEELLGLHEPCHVAREQAGRKQQQ